MNTNARRYSSEEFAQRGDGWYRQKITPEIETLHSDEFVAIDIESGEFEIDAVELQAVRRLRQRLPAAQPWMRRVGSNYLHRFGGRGVR
jgi:hypothetical protein